MVEKKKFYAPSINLYGELKEEKNQVYLDNRDLDSKSAYLNFSIPIFNKSLEYSALKTAKNNYLSKDLELDIQRSELETKLWEYCQNYLMFRNNAELSKKLVSLSEMKVKKLTESAKYRARNKDLMLNAKIELNNLKISLLNNQKDQLKYLTKINFLTGEL